MGDKRRAGKIEAVTYDNDHGDPPILFIHIHFPGFSQGFGGFCVGAEKDAAYKAALCDVLGVTTIDDAVGLDVFGLWCRGEHNEAMEGIERNGKRFTITAFRRSNFPANFKTAKERAQDSILSTIAWAERRKREAEASLATLDAEWTEWETMPGEGTA